MKTFILLLTSTLIWAFDQCPTEFLGLQNQCQCQDNRQGKDLWCPDSEKPRLRFHLQPRTLWIECHEVDEATLRFHLMNISMKSSLVDTVGFKLCPIPGISYEKVMEDMELDQLQELRIEYGFTEKLVAQQFSNQNSSLKRLHIRISDFESIDPEAFLGLDQLEHLYLTSNRRLTSLANENLFAPLTNLESLDIDQNGVKKMATGIFSPLQKLKHLKLKIGLSPTAAMFSKTEKLTSVELANLNGSEIGSDPVSLFTHMSELKNVTLSGIDLFKLPANLFEFNSKLAFFEWRYDKCTSSDCIVNPSSFVRNATNLLEFRISKSFTRNGILLNEDFFWGCNSLRSVRINRAKMKNLPSLLFRDTLKLTEIDLSYNYLEELDPSLFHNIRRLHILNLQNNRLEQIDGQLLAKATELKTLDLSKNQIVNISVEAFINLIDLETLDISHNKIAINEDNEPDWRAMTNLKKLLLSDNEISLGHIPAHFRTTYTQLSELNLSGNKIGPKLDVLPDLIFPASNNLSVDLSKNRLEFLSYDSALAHLKGQKYNVHININENPLTCDCRNANLALHLKEKNRNWFEFSSQPSCQDTLLSQIDLSSMSCQLPEKCPQFCSCDFTPYQSPLNLLPHVSVNCPRLPPFVPLIKNVQELILNMTNASLTSLTHLKNVTGFSQITGLMVSHNNLTQLQWTDLPPKLSKLAINHNQITHIENPERLKGLKALWLGSNPYSCDCQAKFLYRMVRSSPKSVQDTASIRLQCPEGSRAVNNITEIKEFCIETKEQIVAIALPISLVILAVLVVLVLFLIYRDLIYIWLYSKPVLRPIFFSDEDNADKKFDVFVSYSNEDKDFVEDKMVPRLEDDEFKYRCLVHVRDFVLGRSIMEQIIEAVESSCCTLIVLSKNFVESEWARHEFEAAHSKGRVIVVVKGELPPKEDMPLALYDYVKTNTYLSWNDPWFWQKLTYALPHRGGSKPGCLQRLFGRRPPTDQLNLLQTVASRHNSVSPTEI